MAASTEANGQLEAVTDLILDYLESNSMFETRRVLLSELALMPEGSASSHTELERRLGMDPRRSGPQSARMPPTIEDHTPQRELARMIEQLDVLSDDEEWHNDAVLAPQHMRLYSFHPLSPMHNEGSDSGIAHSSFGSYVVFHPSPVLPVAESARLARLSLPVVYNPAVNGPEDMVNLTLEIGSILIGRYKVMAALPDGQSSRIYRCLDVSTNGMVAVKVQLHEGQSEGMLGLGVGWLLLCTCWYSTREAAHHAPRRSFTTTRTASMQGSGRSLCSRRSQSSTRRPSWHGSGSPTTSTIRSTFSLSPPSCTSPSRASARSSPPRVLVVSCVGSFASAPTVHDDRSTASLHARLSTIPAPRHIATTPTVQLSPHLAQQLTRSYHSYLTTVSHEPCP